MNMHDSYTYLMYGKYSLFYESLKNWGYYAHHKQCVPGLSSGWGEGGKGPGDEAKYRVTLRKHDPALAENCTLSRCEECF